MLLTSWCGHPAERRLRERSDSQTGGCTQFGRVRPVVAQQLNPLRRSPLPAQVMQRRSALFTLVEPTVGAPYDVNGPDKRGCRKYEVKENERDDHANDGQDLGFPS